jgi:hypothetical protein
MFTIYSFPSLLLLSHHCSRMLAIDDMTFESSVLNKIDVRPDPLAIQKASVMLCFLLNSAPFISSELKNNAQLDVVLSEVHSYIP